MFSLLCVCCQLTEEEVQKMRVVCRMGREVLDLAALAVRPGVRCSEIDTIVHEACMERKCYPSPLNYRKFPKSVCTSVNEVGSFSNTQKSRTIRLPFRVDHFLRRSTRAAS